jgi:hypothetical protein
LSKGGFVDSTNNDVTSNRIHSALGEQQGYDRALEPEKVMNTHQMLEIPEEEEAK